MYDILYPSFCNTPCLSAPSLVKRNDNFDSWYSKLSLCKTMIRMWLFLCRFYEKPRAIVMHEEIYVFLNQIRATIFTSDKYTESPWTNTVMVGMLVEFEKTSIYWYIKVIFTSFNDLAEITKMARNHCVEITKVERNQHHPSLCPLNHLVHTSYSLDGWEWSHM